LLISVHKETSAIKDIPGRVHLFQIKGLVSNCHLAINYGRMRARFLCQFALRKPIGLCKTSDHRTMVDGRWNLRTHINY